jgi:hypothetical protein
MKNRKTQRPSDDRVIARVPAAGEVKAALATYEQLKRPLKPPARGAS